jgi:L-amino acid N-acyltransferase YncA
MPRTVRLATRDDVPDILEIYNEAVLNTTASSDLEPVSQESRLEWFAEKQASGHPVFVAEGGADFLGWATYGLFRTKPGYAYSAEHSVYVAAGAGVRAWDARSCCRS